MTINIAFGLEQQQRVENDLVALENQREKEAERNTELYRAGDFDGGIGIEPDSAKWREYAYRSGFLTGVTRHYDKKYGMSLANEPF